MMAYIVVGGTLLVLAVALIYFVVVMIVRLIRGEKIEIHWENFFN